MVDEQREMLGWELSASRCHEVEILESKDRYVGQLVLQILPNHHELLLLHRVVVLVDATRRA